MSKIPSVWMEARCGSVCGVNSPNWQMPEECQQTAEGVFARSLWIARTIFLKQGWKEKGGEWWCPACFKLMED